MSYIMPLQLLIPPYLHITLPSHTLTYPPASFTYNYSPPALISSTHPGPHFPVLGPFYG